MTLPDGSKKEFPAGVTVREVAESIGKRLARDAIAATVNGELTDLHRPLDADASVVILTAKNPEVLGVIRHSAAHVMADAVTRLFPKVNLAIGPAIEHGFYYDFDLPTSLSDDDLAKIEAVMAEIVKADIPFVREEVSREDALRQFEAAGQTYKLEILRDLGDQRITIYRHGPFMDLCRGPHVPRTGWIKAFKLQKVAGAYWRGDEKRPMLQRIYGTAFLDTKDLETHVAWLEEVRKRDHRQLIKQLDLISFHEEAGPGLAYWHPKGAIIRKTIEDFWRDRHLAGGYGFVYTPHMGKAWLWKTSGHLDFYRESMYDPMGIDEEEYFVKPMNCPFHILIYKTRQRSYRDLPLRWAELGTVYRYEKSGVLHGLLRVRGFTQDDAHLICTPEQMEGEVARVLRFSLEMLRTFGFREFRAFLATRPEKAVGDPARWEQAQAALERAIRGEGIPFDVDAGGGAFYGPKIDLKISDALGRDWQLSTIQFDFNLPDRFDMTYVGEDNTPHRPYMIHRALLGSIERFFGILVEHYAGKFPLWLAPVQARIIPVTDRQREAAEKIAGDLVAAGFRAEADVRNVTMNLKIRDGAVEKIPYLAVLGDREAGQNQVALRSRDAGDLGATSVETLVKKLRLEVDARQ
ncbi:MAG: threonine--tRNA ligase [Planctomycetota bacterium]